jgi:transcriptional regulator with XRE-family HTH domain
MRNAMKDGITVPEHRLPEERNASERTRDYRRQKGLSLRELARRANVSASFVQQLESGQSNASIASLQKISAALGVSIAQLLAPHTEPTRGVLRAHERPIYSTENGAVKYVMSLPPIADVEIYQVVFSPGGSTGTANYSHDNCQEFLIVTSGTVALWLEEQKYVMAENDSIEYRSSTPHRVVNESDAPATVIWVTGPDLPAGR